MYKVNVAIFTATLEYLVKYGFAHTNLKSINVSYISPDYITWSHDYPKVAFNFSGTVELALKL